MITSVSYFFMQYKLHFNNESAHLRFHDDLEAFTRGCRCGGLNTLSAVGGNMCWNTMYLVHEGIQKDQGSRIT
jgi:hypothetical protein